MLTNHEVIKGWLGENDHMTFVPISQTYGPIEGVSGKDKTIFENLDNEVLKYTPDPTVTQAQQDLRRIQLVLNTFRLVYRGGATDYRLTLKVPDHLTYEITIEGQKKIFWKLAHILHRLGWRVCHYNFNGEEKKYTLTISHCWSIHPIAWHEDIEKMARKWERFKNIVKMMPKAQVDPALKTIPIWDLTKWLSIHFGDDNLTRTLVIGDLIREDNTNEQASVIPEFNTNQ